MKIMFIPLTSPLVCKATTYSTAKDHSSLYIE